MFKKRWVIVTLSVIAFLIVVRAALPFAIKAFMNSELEKIEGYTGHVDDVDLALIRGAYDVKGFTLYSKNSKNVIAISFDALRVQIPWLSLIRTPIVVRADLKHPEVFFHLGSTKELKEQAKEAGDKAKTQDWQTAFRRLFPFVVDYFAIREGRFHFQDPKDLPGVEFILRDFHLVGENLTNTTKSEEGLYAQVHATGVTTGDGKLTVDVKVNPSQKPPRFDLDTQLKELQLRALNPILSKYGKFDVEKGTLDLFVEAASTETGYKGYVKPLFRGLDILNYDKEKKKKNALRLFWEGIVGAVAEIFENQQKDQLATKIPISMTYDNPNVDVWSTVSALLGNAFIRALLPRLDRTVRLDIAN